MWDLLRFRVRPPLWRVRPLRGPISCQHPTKYATYVELSACGDAPGPSLLRPVSAACSVCIVILHGSPPTLLNTWLRARDLGKTEPPSPTMVAPTAQDVDELRRDVRARLMLGGSSLLIFGLVIGSALRPGPWTRGELALVFGSTVLLIQGIGRLVSVYRDAIDGNAAPNERRQLTRRWIKQERLLFLRCASQARSLGRACDPPLGESAPMDHRPRRNQRNPDPRGWVRGPWTRPAAPECSAAGTRGLLQGHDRSRASVGTPRLLWCVADGVPRFDAAPPCAHQREGPWDLEAVNGPPWLNGPAHRAGTPAPGLHRSRLVGRLPRWHGPHVLL